MSAATEVHYSCLFYGRKCYQCGYYNNRANDCGDNNPSKQKEMIV